MDAATATARFDWRSSCLCWRCCLFCAVLTSSRLRIASAPPCLPSPPACCLPASVGVLHGDRTLDSSSLAARHHHLDPPDFRPSSGCARGARYFVWRHLRRNLDHDCRRVLPPTGAAQRIAASRCYRLLGGRTTSAWPNAHPDAAVNLRDSVVFLYAAGVEGAGGVLVWAGEDQDCAFRLDRRSFLCSCSGSECGPGSTHPAVDIPELILIYAVLVLIVLRFGLVPLLVGAYSPWICWQTFLFTRLLRVVCDDHALGAAQRGGDLPGWGFYHSLGGEPLWKVEME